jgi:hypothetical protein
VIADQIEIIEFESGLFGTALSEIAQFSQEVGRMDRLGKNFEVVSMKFGGCKHVCSGSLS